MTDNIKSDLKKLKMDGENNYTKVNCTNYIYIYTINHLLSQNVYFL